MSYVWPNSVLFPEVRCKIVYCATLCSQALLLMKNEFDYVCWLGQEDYLCYQGGLFLLSSPTEFHAMAHRHMVMCMRKEFHHLRQLTPVKTAVLAIKTNKFFQELELVINWVRVELWWAMIYKVIPHLIFNKTHLITGSSKIISSENLAEKTAVFGRKNILFGSSLPLYTTKFNPSGTLSFSG